MSAQAMRSAVAPESGIDREVNAEGVPSTEAVGERMMEHQTT